MTRAGIFETVVGVGVLAVAAAFLAYGYSASGAGLERDAYKIDAMFGRVDGVTVGSEVRIAGVKVGSVAGSRIDPKTYEARLQLAIARDVKIPEDSTAKIVAHGLLGEAHVAIEPGASDAMLEDGGVITVTQGSVDLLGLAVRAFTETSADKNVQPPGKQGEER